VYNAKYVDYIADRLSEVKNVDISPYITSIEVPEEYSNAIYSARDSAVSGMKDLWERPEMNMVRGNLNKVYQQVRFQNNQRKSSYLVLSARCGLNTRT